MNRSLIRNQLVKSARGLFVIAGVLVGLTLTSTSAKRESGAAAQAAPAKNPSHKDQSAANRMTATSSTLTSRAGDENRTRVLSLGS